MIRVLRRLFPLDKEGELNRLKSENAQLKQANADTEAALVELAELAAAQDDALVEIAGLIGE